MSSGANPQALLPGKGEVTGQGVSVLPPQGRVQSSTPPLSQVLSTPSPFLSLSGVQRNYLYICINVYLVTVSLFPWLHCPPPSMAIAPASSTLYIMYRKSLCMVKGGRGGFRELGDPSPQTPFTGQDLC